ncbi:hypothetical protein RN001_001888 [Aquatica leii]|uniref:Uncharacterized protein n=1 Tax=Aquatica leii TaxID=1421715 RepID=A0AAN7SJT8_9COLE|nr:hypothetical protein RN001_001888 [Aquatica leii]
MGKKSFKMDQFCTDLQSSVPPFNAYSNGGAIVTSIYRCRGTHKEIDENNEPENFTLTENKITNQLTAFNLKTVTDHITNSHCYQDTKNLQNWVDTVEVGNSVTSENKKINIISNILVNDGLTNQNNNFVPRVEFENKENISPNGSTVCSQSIVPPTISTKSDDYEFDKLSVTDDSEKDPNYQPSSDGDKGVETVSKPNYKDRRDFCIYCETDVSHFARHIATWHSSEIEVVRILSEKDPKLKRLGYSQIRKRGNFLRNRINDKHTKKCYLNNEGKFEKRQTSQSDGQTTLLLGTQLKYDKLLNSELFPRMRADEISIIAKKDFLICQYAYSYLKGRRTKGNLDLVRQNVRRLAKLLIFAQKRDSTIKSLICLLRPCHFKTIVDGVNEMARYNHETEKYESPTLAINFGTLIKKCCDLAFIELLQKQNTNEHRKDVKILKTLIISQWADEVSAQAGTNLNENKWNKDELLPLTTDLKKLNDYLIDTAEIAYNTLKTKNDVKAYYELKDILFSEIILLNRRRPAEVAQLKLKTYQSINLDASGPDTEFKSCLTETERILLNTYSRFVIRGKRGRGVPVLLSPSMKQHFDLLITKRIYFVSNNDYIFHTKGSGFIDGTKTLRKYVQKCGITRVNSITATSLRKHLATITQLLQFSNNDMEQLSKFMGHTLRTHCSVYRLSDNVYQTAKISKLLLLMSQGGAQNFIGKSLDDITIDLTPVQDKPQNMEEIIQNIISTDEKMVEPNSNDNHINISRDSSGKSKIKILPRQAWTVEEKKLIFQYFEKNIRKKIAPKQAEVQNFTKKYPQLFHNRKWTSIKAVVYNIYTGKLKV